MYCNLFCLCITNSLLGSDMSLAMSVLGDFVKNLAMETPFISQTT